METVSCFNLDDDFHIVELKLDSFCFFETTVKHHYYTDTIGPRKSVSINYWGVRIKWVIFKENAMPGPKKIFHNNEVQTRELNKFDLCQTKIKDTEASEA